MSERQTGICGGNGDALKNLYTEYFRPLAVYLKKRFRFCTHQAEDVAQSAFEKIVESESRDAIGNFRAFLWRTAHNIAISDMRAISAARRHEGESGEAFICKDDDWRTPDRVFEGRERMEIVMETLRRMPERRRRVFLLARVGGLSHTEVAERVGISRPAVSRHVARATADLYAALYDAAENKRK